MFSEIVRTGEEVVTNFKILFSNSPRRTEYKNEIGQSVQAVFRPRKDLGTSQIKARIFTPLINLLG